VISRGRRAAAALAVVAVLGAGCGEGGAARFRAPEIGDPAPPYAGLTLAGDSASLAALRGEPVLLNIWATWCHPCRTEIPELERLHQAFEPRGLRVIGVSIDAGGEDAAVRDFAAEYRMTYPVWRDPDGRVSTLFGAIGVPATYLIDRTGVLRWRKVGPIAEGDPALARAIEEAVQSQTAAAPRAASLSSRPAGSAPASP
jgi:cytochrome c-type biogenesis protein